MYHNHLDNYENALDQGTDNTWDNGYPSGGNWWSDYTGTDDNEDGIGDIPYSKNGVTDLYPTGKFQSTQNQDPVATIQSIQPSTASYGEPVQFTGSGWDPDGDSIVGYHWRSSMQGPLSTQASFSTTSLSPGSHVIFFKVQDSNGAWSPEKTRSITVTNPQNQAPIAHIQSISPQNPDFGEPVWFQGYGTDADGTIFSYKWVSSLDDVINTSLSFSTSLLSVGTHSISFFVMDNEGEWSEADHGVVTVTATSTATNQPPTANPGGPYTIEVNTTLILDGSDSFDPDGTIVVYSWDFGDDTTGKGRTVDHQYSTVGNKTIVLQVTDNNGTSSTASTKVTVVATGMLPDNNDINQNDEPGLVLPIPQTLLLPLAIIIVFFGVFGGFLYWVKRPR